MRYVALLIGITGVALSGLFLLGAQLNFHLCEGAHINGKFANVIPVELTSDSVSRAIAKRAEVTSRFQRIDLTPQQTEELWKARYILLESPQKELREVVNSFGLQRNITIHVHLIFDILLTDSSECDSVLKLLVLSRVSAIGQVIATPLRLLNITEWGAALLVVAFMMDRWVLYRRKRKSKQYSL